MTDVVQPRVFISYRRSDSSPYARSIYEELVKRFGNDNVFYDISSIHAGQDFVETLEATLAEVDVVLAVVGPTWSASLHSEHDGTQDFVRMEVGAALARQDVRVIPVLVDGAQMPAASSLPEDLAPLTRRNAVTLLNDHFTATMAELGRALDPEWDREPASVPPPRRRPYALVALVVAGLVLIPLAIFAFTRDTGSGGGTTATTSATTKPELSASPVSVAPSQRTSVTGQNFGPSTQYTLAQCWVSQDEQTSHCDSSTAVPVATDGDGTFSRPFTVAKTVTGADDGQTYDCSASYPFSDCVLSITNDTATVRGPGVTIGVKKHDAPVTGEGTIP